MGDPYVSYERMVARQATDDVARWREAQRLYVVGEVKRSLSGEWAWELIGVYDDRRKAEAACTSTQHFVGPVSLNERAPSETTDWPGAYYPMRH